MPELLITKVEKGKIKKKCSHQVCCGCWTTAGKKISDPWPGNILHHGFVFALVGLDLNNLLHWVHERKLRKDRNYGEWFFFCSCLGKMHPFQWGKTHIYIHAEMGRQLGRRIKPSKTSNSIVVTSFIDSHSLSSTLSETRDKNSLCRSTWCSDGLCWVLSRGWADGITQSRSSLTSPMGSLHQGQAHFSFLTQPYQGKPHWNCLCEMLLSPWKWLSPTSSFPPQVLPTGSHISLLVATQCSRLGKWPVLRLPCHQQKQRAIFNLFVPGERVWGFYAAMGSQGRGCQTPLSLLLRPFPTPLVQLLWPNIICHSQVPPGCPQKMRLQPSSDPRTSPVPMRSRNDGFEKRLV